MSTQTFDLGGRTVEIGKADKVLFPNAGVTESDLADYYARIADTMLPHLAGRPVTMQRFPDGIGEKGFYQKKAPDHFPNWIRRVSIEVEERDDTQPQVVCGDAATLLDLVDQACITPHAWLSRASALQHPDRLIFDLDPPSDDFAPVRFAVRALPGGPVATPLNWDEIGADLHRRPTRSTTSSAGWDRKTAPGPTRAARSCTPRTTWNPLQRRQ